MEPTAAIMPEPIYGFTDKTIPSLFASEVIICLDVKESAKSVRDQDGSEKVRNNAVQCFKVALEFFFTNIHIPMVKTSHITMPYDHLFKTKKAKAILFSTFFIFFVWQFSLTVVKRKNKVIITANQCQETCHMEPGELKVRKQNYLKRRKTLVNKSRLVLVWNFFV